MEAVRQFMLDAAPEIHEAIECRRDEGPVEGKEGRGRPRRGAAKAVRRAGGEAVQPSSGTRRPKLPTWQGTAARGVGLWGSVRVCCSAPRARWADAWVLAGLDLDVGNPRCSTIARTPPGAVTSAKTRPSPASTHSGEHVPVERPSTQLGPIHSRRPLLQQILAGRCLGLIVRFLRT